MVYKGNDITHNEWRRIHLWLKKNKRKNQICLFCGRNGKTEFALIKGKTYANNVNHFTELCPSCHRKYDVTESFKQKMSIIRSGQQLPKKWKPIIGTKDKTSIAFKSVKEAARITETHQPNISHCLHNRLKSTNGYTWKYSNK